MPGPSEPRKGKTKKAVRVKTQKPEPQKKAGVAGSVCGRGKAGTKNKQCLRGLESRHYAQQAEV